MFLNLTWFFMTNQVLKGSSITKQDKSYPLFDFIIKVVYLIFYFLPYFQEINSTYSFVKEIQTTL